MRCAEIIAVGSELLSSERVDTNSLWLTEQLNRLGVEVIAKAVVGDDLGRLTEMIRTAVERTPLVFITGGLGPTEDDLTRDAVALATGCSLALDTAVLEELRAKFASRGRTMAPNNERQAMVPEGAEVLPNPNGTAPGLFLLRGDHRLVILPGPPRENQPMFTREVLSRLPLGEQRLARTVLHVAGLGESDMDALIAPIYKPLENPTTGILFTPVDLEIHLTARGPSLEECERLNSDLADRMAEVLGKNLYSRGESMEAVVGLALKQRGKTLATAESLTGGLIGERVTRVPGSSEWFVGSLVTYTEDAKQRLLGVPAELIQEHSAVSAPGVEAMAAGARSRIGADYALAVTGYAGPDGGTAADPVGTFYVGLACAEEVSSMRFQVPGQRELVRTRCSQAALDYLRRKRLL